MSFTITLQKNSSPTNKVGKSLTNIALATGVLRESTSILDPVIEVRSALTTEIITGVNYMYIPQFGRYYFVTNIKSTYNKLWEISGHVDVLQTYADKIKEQKGIVSRQENEFNMFFDDGWFMAYQNPIVQKKLFSVATPFESEEYVLVVAGNSVDLS